MKITVIIPTYRRPNDLARCLEALKQQTRPADEVLLVVRDTDDETHKFLRSFNPAALPLRTVKVNFPGVVVAMNVGFEAAEGDILTVTDDDAAPHHDWLKRIEIYFQNDEKVGGVGGRDYMYLGTQLLDGAESTVGKLQWFGRMVGNHHLGIGPAREVDLLKGVNMSFRKLAIAGLRCDDRLKGNGAQVHFEVALCLSVKQRGWKLIYDPAIAVDHYPAQRFDEDQRNQFNFTAWSNCTYNETIILLDYLSPLQRIIFLTWSVLIGTRAAFGFIQVLRFLSNDSNLAIQKWFASQQGRWHGMKDWTQNQRQKNYKNLNIASKGDNNDPK